MQGGFQVCSGAKKLASVCSVWHVELMSACCALPLEEAEAFLRAAGLDPAEVAKLGSSKDHKHKKSKKGHKHKDKQEKHKHSGKDRADKSPLSVD